MKQKGRKSVASLAVVSAIGTSRPSPPGELNDAEKALWSRVTATKTVDFFDDGIVPLLVEYCRLKTSIDLVSVEIEIFDPDWLKVTNGAKHYKMLTDIRDKAQGRMIALARSMRLTNQSRFQPSTAGTRSSASKNNDRLWQR